MSEKKVLRDALMEILAITGYELEEKEKDLTYVCGMVQGIAENAIHVVDEIERQGFGELSFEEMLANEESEEDPLEYLLDEE